MIKINVAVFPCGSEVGMEIYRALRFSQHFHLIGLNSVSDHGRMIYNDYVGDLPFFKEEKFLSSLQKIIKERNIQFLIPAMDEVASSLKKYESILDCEIVCAKEDVVQLLTSKRRTYEKLNGIIPTPEIFDDYETIKSNLPVFSKPDIGYGSRDAELIRTEIQLRKRWEKKSELIFCENLPGSEYTIDCFSDRYNNVLFTGSRIRKRIRMGISVNTLPVELKDIQAIAQNISSTLKLEGLWFFQMKEDKNGELKLLEVASRVSGSMALFRLKGINFILLELFQRLGHPISIQENELGKIELERSFNCKLISDFKFDTIYMDFDDCLIIDQQVNTLILRFLFQQINQSKKIILLTKHDGDLDEQLQKFRISNLFDEIIHIKKSDQKYQYIDRDKSIFVDDSHREREEVINRLGIPAFAPDAIEALIDESKL